MSKEITSREKDYSQWYNDLVIKGGLADHSEVKGCMVIKPYGFGLWEKMRDQLDKMFKDTGHVNAYFPLFIPKSFLSKEAAHVEGFAKECAVVTHYRLMKDPNGGVIVDPTAKLEEELIVRPTSETIIWNTYRDWIRSYRDLPLLINQWANVVRWEMRTRLFLRTTEFLWQEGHTAHATAAGGCGGDAADAGCLCHVRGAIHGPAGDQRGQNAERAFCRGRRHLLYRGIDAGRQGLQAGTSHFLGQNFAKAFEVKFSDKNNQLEYVWATSWGVSTRLIGGLVMAHSDDDGMILPPRIAPLQVVIVPIYKGEERKTELDAKGRELAAQLKAAGISVKFDDNDNNRPGFKFAEYELKGVPVRMAMGLRDLDNNSVEVARRDTKEKTSRPMEGLVTISGICWKISSSRCTKGPGIQG
jgi:prolyl-tRNA synthetase